LQDEEAEVACHQLAWEIPVEIEYTSCPEWRFRATPSSHRPSREECSQQLQRAFDQHFKTVHASEESGKVSE